MNSGGELIGDIAQGALTARAVEPGHGEGDDGHTHETACLNCGTGLIGRHCHGCGQAAHVHRSLGAFFHDLLHGVFHFEGKIWRTLPLLVWNPGRLTREYIDGRRASYVSPIALFLFVVFLTFAVFNALGNPVDFVANATSTEKARVEAEQDLARLEARKAEASARGETIPGLDGQIAGARSARDAVAAIERGELPDSIAETSGVDSGPTDAVNAAWRKAKANPQLLIYKLQTSAYKYSWLLIPLSLPFVWLLFPFSRRFHLYDHTVFVTYSLSFMLLLLALISLLVVWGASAWLLTPALLYAPFHMGRQLHGTYGLTWFGAWARTWLLSFSAIIVLGLFAVALTTLVAAG
jgi:hypothetical protein